MTGMLLASFVRLGFRILFFSAALASAWAGNLAGIATGSDGKPIPGALVSAIGTSTVPWTNVHTTTGVDGTFSFQGLSAGSYRLCVQVPSGGYLNPCDWSPAAPALHLTASESVSAFPLTVEKGSILKIRINDPNDLLGSAPASILMGVHTPTGLFVSTLRRAHDAAGSDYEVTIPFDTQVKLTLQANQVKLAAADGTVVSGGSPVPVQSSSQAVVSAPPLVFALSK
jgi:carboxypeptidase family protein